MKGIHSYKSVTSGKIPLLKNMFGSFYFGGIKSLSAESISGNYISVLYSERRC